MADNASYLQSRKHIDELFERLKSDAAFRDRMKSDPAAAMRSIGFPEDLIEHVNSGQDEVGGYDYELPCTGAVVGVPSCDLTTVCHQTQFVVRY